MAINLPRFYSTKELPGKSGLVPVSPGMVSRPYEAVSQAGEKIEGLGLHAANVFDKIRERERNASDALQAVELGHTLDNEGLEIADKFKDRIDYENFDKDIENEITSLKDRIRPKEASPELNLVYEKIFNQQSFQLKTTIRNKKYKVMEERGKIAFGTTLDKAYQDYSDTNDPQQREIIKNQLVIDGEILRRRNVIDPLWIDQKLKSFDKDALKVATDLADVKADKAIMANPGRAVIDLTDSKYLPDLLPKQRQDKIEKANAAFKVFGNEQEKKVKEQQKLAHDSEERDIGNLFMAGSYKDAYVSAFKSKFLTGDEKKSWANAIETKSKEKKEPEEDDPAEYFNILQDVLGATAEKKFEIGTKIVQSGRLKTGTKKTLIKDLLETKEDQQIFNDSWFKFAEKSIKESLGWTEMMGFFNLQNPQEAQSSYRDVVRQLIIDIKKDNLKGEEIDKRGRQLALPHQMKVWNLLMGGKKEEPKKKEPLKYNVGQIYTDAQGRKAKYLGAGKWETVK